MPEDATATIPTGTMSHESQPSGPIGIDRMMAQLDRAEATGKPVSVEPEKPVTAPATKPEAAPEKPAPAPAPAAVKPEAKPDTKPQQAQDPDAEWDAAPPKWKKIYQNHKAKTAEQVRSLESKIQNLEKKPFESPGDAAKLATYEKQLEEIKAEATTWKQKATAKDYYATEDYKLRYADPANRVYEDAVAHIQRVRVNDNGEQRLATQADFDFIRRLPIDARRKAAAEMFGDNAADVIDFTREIDRYGRDAAIAAQHHLKNYERTALESETKTKAERQQYEGQYKQALTGLKEHENGKWFRDDPEDPEGSKIFSDYFTEIERLDADLSKLPPDQRAGYTAFWKSSAAAFPRALLENNRLSAKLAAMEEELAKYRSADPGAKGSQGVTPAGDGAQKRMSIDDAAAEFDKAPR